MKNLIFVIFFVLTLVSNAHAQEIKKIEDCAMPISATETAAIISMANMEIPFPNISPSPVIPVITPSESGVYANRKLRFTVVRPLPAGSIVTAAIFFADGRTWPFQGYQLTSSAEPGSTFELITLGQFGGLFGESTDFRVVVQTKDATTVVTTRFEAFGRYGPVTSTHVAPKVQAVKREVNRIVIEGKFEKAQTDVVIDYLAINPIAVRLISKDKIVIDLDIEERLRSLTSRSYVVTVMQNNRSGSSLEDIE